MAPPVDKMGCMVYISCMATDIAQKLEDINQTLKGISAAIAKPKESKIVRYMEVGVLFVGVFGIIQLIDIIIKWVTGG